MSKLSTFFYSLKNSLVSPRYYNDILKVPLGFSVKFFLFFFFLYSLAITAVITARVIIPLQDLIQTLPEQVREVYPAELEVYVRSGEVSTNVEEPYYFSISSVLNTVNENIFELRTASVENLLVIDTNATAEDYENYDTIALLTKNQIVFQLENQEKEVVPLRDIDNVVITQESFGNFIDMTAPYLNYVVPILIAVTLAGSIIFWPLVNLIYIALYSLAALILAKLLSLTLNYKQCFQLSLHLIALPTLVFLIIDAFLLPMAIPFLFTIFLMIWTVLVLQKLEPRYQQNENIEKETI